MSVEIDLGGGSYEEAADRTPVGVISAFGGTSAPDGWLMCNGDAKSRTTYADLYNVIGTAFGEGDGSTTFNLPDLRGRFVRGVDNGEGRDPDVGDREEMATGGNTGDAVGSIQDDAFQGHGHQESNARRADDNAGGTQVPQWGWTNAVYPGPAKVGETIATSHGTPREADETRPVNAYVNFIIKY